MTSSTLPGNNSYRQAIEWIAARVPADINGEAVQNLDTVLLVAEIFDTAPGRVADDVLTKLSAGDLPPRTSAST